MRVPLRELELILATLKVIKEKEGGFTLKDAADIQASINAQYGAREEAPESKDAILDLKHLIAATLSRELTVKENMNSPSKVIPGDTHITDIEEAPLENKAKHRYAHRRTKTEMQAIKNPQSDPSLVGNMLGAYLRKAAIINRLTALGSKYGAGVPMRMRTLILKHGNQDLLHTDINMVSEKALTSLPRTGPKMWEVFKDIRDFGMPKNTTKLHDMAELEKIKDKIESDS
jgi:hypothetical protein